MSRVPLVAALLALALAGPSCGGGSAGGGGGGGSDTDQSGAVAQDGASVTPNAVTAARRSGPGEFAADYLRSTNFTSLVVEIDYPQGKPPSAVAVSLLRARLAQHCDKPDGVTIDVDEAIPASEFDDTMSVERIAEIEATYRDTYSDLASATAAFYVLYVSGASDLDDSEGSVLGLAYAGSSLALFIDSADPGPGAPVTQVEIEATTLVHEAGHLLGLVDGGCPMVTAHEDRSHEFHCSVRSCVMFWTVTIDPDASVFDLDFAAFDPHCSDDMEAFGGNGVPARVEPLSLRPRFVAGVCGHGAWRRALAARAAR